MRRSQPINKGKHLFNPPCIAHMVRDGLMAGQQQQYILVPGERYGRGLGTPPAGSGPRSPPRPPYSL